RALRGEFSPCGRATEHGLLPPGNRASVTTHKPIRSWRTYKAVAGKVVKEVQIVNDTDSPDVTIYFRDGTQFRIQVHPSVEFTPRLEKITKDDLHVLHGYPRFKEVKR